MKRLLIACLLAFAAWADAQTLVGVSVPDLSHPAHEAAMAKVLSQRWGVVVLALEMPGSPTAKIDRAPLRRFTERTLRAGKLPMVRMPNGAYPNRWWTEVFGKYETPNLPPRAAWPTIRRIEGEWLAAIREGCALAGQPASKVYVCLATEICYGSVGGMQKGSWGTLGARYAEFLALWKGYIESPTDSEWAACKAKWLEVYPAWTWEGGPRPEGWIEQAQLEFVRNRRFANSYSGFKVVANTFEMSNEASARQELQSFLLSPDGRSLLSSCTYLGVDVYEDDARRYFDHATRKWRAGFPHEIAQRWFGKVVRRLQWASIYVEFDLERWVVPEFNIREDRIPAGYLVSDYRQPMIDVVPDLFGMVEQPVEVAAMFTMVSGDAASLRVGLYAWQQSNLAPIGFEVAP